MTQYSKSTYFTNEKKNITYVPLIGNVKYPACKTVTNACFILFLITNEYLKIMCKMKP